MNQRKWKVTKEHIIEALCLASETYTFLNDNNELRSKIERLPVIMIQKLFTNICLKTLWIGRYLFFAKV